MVEHTTTTTTLQVPRLQDGSYPIPFHPPTPPTFSRSGKIFSCVQLSPSLLTDRCSQGTATITRLAHPLLHGESRYNRHKHKKESSLKKKRKKKWQNVTLSYILFFVQFSSDCQTFRLPSSQCAIPTNISVPR